MTSDDIGFVGLGNMGRPMATNLVASGRSVVVHDAAGTQARAPRGARLAASNAALAAVVEVVHLCVPDGRASESIAREIAGAPDRTTRLIVDHSTIGTAAAVRVHALLAGHGVEYVDAPVSGGVSGAVAATLAIMYSGAGTTFEALRPAFEAMAGNVFRVGSGPGPGPGDEGAQQLPVRHRDGGDRRGGRVRRSARSGHEDDPGRGERIERTQHRDHRQVPQPGPDRHLRCRVLQHAAQRRTSGSMATRPVRSARRARSARRCPTSGGASKRTSRTRTSRASTRSCAMHARTSGRRTEEEIALAPVDTRSGAPTSRESRLADRCRPTWSDIRRRGYCRIAPSADLTCRVLTRRTRGRGTPRWSGGGERSLLSARASRPRPGWETGRPERSPTPRGPRAATDSTPRGGLPTLSNTPPPPFMRCRLHPSTTNSCFSVRP